MITKPANILILLDVNKILSNHILASCVSVSMMPDKLLMEHIMLLAILSSHVGIDVGKFSFTCSKTS